MGYKLSELVGIIRGKDADPFITTIDIFFKERDNYQMVKNSGVITRELIATLYKVPLEGVYPVYYFDQVMGIKISYMKNIPNGWPGAKENCNATHVPLLDVEVPSKKSSTPKTQHTL